jgi:hypothetical protein
MVPSDRSFPEPVTRPERVALELDVSSHAPPSPRVVVPANSIRCAYVALLSMTSWLKFPIVRFWSLCTTPTTLGSIIRLASSGPTGIRGGSMVSR